MKGIRISIVGAMGCVLVAGLLLALVRVESRTVQSPLEGIADGARYLSVAILVIATCRARYGKGKEADWWFGYALSGWSYYVLSLDMHSAWSFPTHQPRSLVSQLPHWVVDLSPSDVRDRIVLTHPYLGALEVRSYLVRVVQALLVLAVGCAGGFAGLILARRRASERTDARRFTRAQAPSEQDAIARGVVDDPSRVVPSVEPGV